MRWRGINSQQELARISGVSQSCIHRILTRGDSYSPKRTTLLALARALDTTAVWLSDGITAPMLPLPRTSTMLNDACSGTRCPADAYATRSPAASLPATGSTSLPTSSSTGIAEASGPSGISETAEIDRLVRALTPAERSALLPLLRLIVKASAATARPRSS